MNTEFLFDSFFLVSLQKEQSETMVVTDMHQIQL